MPLSFFCIIFIGMLHYMPLSLCLQMSISGDAETQVVPATSRSGSRCNFRWSIKHIEEVDILCNTSFSDPPR